MMFIKAAVVLLSVIMVLVGILAACAGTAPTPTLTPTGPLAQIIEGARREGTVSAQLAPTTFTPKSIERLENEIKKKFGVELDIKYTPMASMPQSLAEELMEHKAGATPTYDLVAFFDVFVLTGMRAGIFESVDWKPLLLEGTNPKVVVENPLMRGGIITHTGHMGVIYNPDKVPADAVPKTLSDLANPKWTGKVAIMNYTSVWVRRAYILGKEKVFADLRAILKNKAIQGYYADEYNRYLLGEVWIAFINSDFLKQAQDKGMPVAWQSLDFAEATDFALVLRKQAPHPNAAKLVAVYLASPDGARFMLEEGGAGSLYYAGNFENELRLQAERQGMPEYAFSTYPGLIDFWLSDKEPVWEKEIDAILKGG